MQQLRFRAFTKREDAERYADVDRPADQPTENAVRVQVHEVPWPNDGTGPTREALVMAFADWQHNVQPVVFEPQDMTDTQSGQGGSSSLLTTSWSSPR